MTVGQFFNSYSGFIEFESEKEKQNWERINYISYSMLVNNAYIKSQDKPKTFDDYMKRTQPKKLTKEEFEAFLNS